MERIVNQQKIPIILIDKSSYDSFNIFNPNEWENESKAIIQSCATELSLIEYISSSLEEICSRSKDICKEQYITLIQQWEKGKWDVSEAEYYVQIPELHLQIVGFFSIAKSLIDIIVKLISSENIVNEKIHGFHKKNDVIGGYLLNILKNNASSSNKQKTKRIHELFVSQKTIWIDELIRLRDSFIHIEEGAFQVMFVMDIKTKSDQLIYSGARSPSINKRPIDEYCKNTLIFIKNFSTLLLKEIKK